ncbi:unnamed protein product [Ectocarpus sp. 6 AP-2014]
MSSGVIPRRMAAIASSRSAFSAAAAHRSLCSHHEQSQHQPGSRGLAHRASVVSSPNEQRLQSPDQLHNQQHKEHGQHDHPHRSHHQQQARRPSMSQAQPQAGVADSSSGVCADDVPQYSVLASQQVLHEATEGQREEWALAQPSPEVRLRMWVDSRFGNRYFVDELPCRTRKSIATAAAAGKEYITARDITRVLDTISDGEHVLTDGEAEAICAAWSDHHPHHKQHHDQQQQQPTVGVGAPAAGVGAGAGASISPEVFLELLGHGNK